jgi:hypothetical protein
MTCSLIIFALAVVGYMWSAGLTLTLLFVGMFVALAEYDAAQRAMTPWERENEKRTNEFYASVRRERRERKLSR